MLMKSRVITIKVNAQKQSEDDYSTYNDEAYL